MADLIVPKIIKSDTSNNDLLNPSLLQDLRNLIDSIRTRIIENVNAELVLLYWRIGERIQTEILKNQRASYGQEIVATLSRQLNQEFGQGFSRANLFRMIQFYQCYCEYENVAALSRQLSWSHFLVLIALEPPLKRNFYTELCRLERWSVRALKERIQSMVFERTAISRKPEELAKKELGNVRDNNCLTPTMTLRDPYILDFLGLRETYNEKDLENAILRELEHFILEFGSDFSFIARQKRLSIGSEDFYLDLLFFNRSLRRLIAIELKLGKFKAADKGQMELYLRWLDKYERKAGEEPPLGIILCAEKDNEQIELLELEGSGIHVAQYFTELPSQELLRVRLNQAIAIAQRRLSTKDDVV